MNIAVIGAGAVGATAAVHLAGSHDVTVYEAESVANGATGRAAGLVYDAYADPIDARLARESVSVFRADRATRGYEFTDCPYLWFATDPGDAASAIERQVDRMQSNGLAVQLIDTETIAARFPSIRTADIHTAAIAFDAGYLSPAAYATRQIERAQEAGVTLREGVAVTVETNPLMIEADGVRESVDAVAIAAGAQTGQLLDAAGLPLAVTPYRVQALTTANQSQGLPMLFDATAEIYTRPHETGLLVGDGTEPNPADPKTYDRSGDDWFIDRATGYVSKRLGNEGSVDRAWAGLCTATPDGDPLLGPVHDGIAVATGWQGHGLMRAPATGRLLARATVTGTAPIERFDPGRFDGTESFDVVPGMRIE